MRPLSIHVLPALARRNLVTASIEAQKRQTKQAELKTTNLSKAHVTRDSSGPAILAISVSLQQ